MSPNHRSIKNHHGPGHVGFWAATAFTEPFSLPKIHLRSRFQGKIQSTQNGFEMLQTSPKENPILNLYIQDRNPWFEFRRQVEFRRDVLLRRQVDKGRPPVPNRLPPLVHRIQDSLVGTSFQQLGLLGWDEQLDPHWN